MSQPPNSPRVKPYSHEVGGIRLKVIGENGAVTLDATLPKTRAECVDAPRPCGRFRCRHALIAVEPVSRVGRRHANRINPPVTLIDLRRVHLGTCALDLAEKGGMSAKEVGVVLGCTVRRAEQILSLAMAKVQLAASCDADLAEDLGAEPDPHSFRTDPEKERVNRVEPTKPIAFAEMVLTVRVGDRSMQVTCNGDQSANLMRLMREARQQCLRQLAREIRDGLTREDGAT